MCGIAGRFSSQHLPKDFVWSTRASELLAHRGPDDSGHFADEHCELVHRRLAINDLSPNGYQPMINEDGTVFVVFNGEIYNHAQLRQHLQSHGHRFRSTADTEVLVHLYEERGEKMLDSLEGMFAFAIYDQRACTLLLARDRFGIKPLYWAEQNGQLIFASEMKAILAFPGFIPKVDRQAVYDYLGLTYVPEPATGFENIAVLPKGTFLLQNCRSSAMHRFWQIRAEPDPNTRTSSAIENAGQLLSETVKRYSVADVKVGTLLSGGLDSSLIVAAHACRSDKPLSTFSVQFPERGYDESPLAKAVSVHCKTQHSVVSLDHTPLSPELLERLFTHFDQPFADTSLIPTYLVCRAIRSQGLKCALSGDGGDEVFGGYARFWRANKFAALMKIPRQLQSAASAPVSLAAMMTRDLGRQLKKALFLARIGCEDLSVLLAGFSNYLNEEEKQKLVPDEARSGLLTVYRLFASPGPQGFTTLEDLSRRITGNLFDVGLPSDMLRKVDMMSMLAGIEIRVPMLDENLTAFGLTLPHSLKTDGHRGKLVLRGLADKWLPKAVSNHPKHGFRIPLDVLLTRDLKDMLHDILLSPSSRTRGLLNVKRVEELISRLCSASRSGNGEVSRDGVVQRVFSFLALELWLQKYKLAW